MITQEEFYHAIEELSEPAAAAFYPFFISAANEFGVTDRTELAEFLGQIAHESGGLVYWEEIWGPTNAQARYGLRSDLGNTDSRAIELAAAKPFSSPRGNYTDVGRFYKGHGPIQTTGYFNHKRVAEKLGIPCDVDPTLLTRPEHGFRAAFLFWVDKKCGIPARAGDTRKVTIKINGGLNGFEDRVKRVAKARRALGILV